MALDTGRAFDFMRVNYKYGLLDEMGSIAGDALDAVMRERGMDLEDVINALDGASEQTVEKLNGLIERWGTLVLRLASNDTMARLQAYLLRKPAARRLAVKAATSVLAGRLPAGGPGPGEWSLPPEPVSGAGPGGGGEVDP